GDLLMNIFLQARIAEEEQRFTLEGVARGISEKLVRRHPHVFGDVDARDSAAVRRKWEAIKREEKEGSGAADIPRGGTLRPLPASMPALQQADRIGRMAAEIGFDWPDPAGPLEKMDEELTELRSEVDREDADGMEREIGDLLFAVTSLARRFEIDPEQALRAALGRFRRRFRRIEAELMASSDLSLATLDRLWERAKREVDGAGSRRRGTAELPPPAGEGR
ncbi:MAG: MazG family protein, partial [Planctomycetota bacterium]